MACDERHSLPDSRYDLGLVGVGCVDRGGQQLEVSGHAIQGKVACLEHGCEPRELRFGVELGGEAQHGPVE